MLIWDYEAAKQAVEALTEITESERAQLNKLIGIFYFLLAMFSLSISLLSYYLILLFVSGLIYLIIASHNLYILESS